MRLWSLHPKYLDSKGLVACWREGLLARAVLTGKTKGYKHHPQLERFKKEKDPSTFLDCYLTGIHVEACQRGYCFDLSKIRGLTCLDKLQVTDGQLKFEQDHLLSKLKSRDMMRYEKLKRVTDPQPLPLFQVRKGGIESWERSLKASRKPR